MLIKFYKKRTRPLNQEKKLKLDQLKPNIFYTIKKISINEDVNIHQRLLDFGFYEGMQIKIMRRLPFGGPWIIQADSLYMALRDEEFKILELE